MAKEEKRHDSVTSSSLGGGLIARFGPALAVFGSVFLLALVVIEVRHVRERTERRLDFERRAAQVARAAHSSFDVPLEVLRSVPGLFEASDDVARAEFRAFVSDALERYPWIYALEWIPRVPGNERAAYEERAKADGIAGYHFKQDAPTGPPVLATARSEYYPLYYMEPPNKVALGLEETALELRKVALERARDLDDTVISERLRLVQDDASVASLIAFHPIYRRGERPSTAEQRQKSVRGFAAMVFRIKPVLTTGLRDLDLAPYDIALVDEGAPEARRLLYESRPDAFAAIERGDSAVSFHDVVLANRKLSIRVRDRVGFVERGSGGWVAFLIAFLASAFAGAFVHVLRAMRRLRRQVTSAKKLGQYTLVEKLGEGAMGVVYRAHHALLRRPTAVKLLQPSRTGELASVRFEREVQLTSSLVHPNTVVVYDYGRSPDGIFYYAMEYIDGITLQDLVDIDGPQPAARVVRVLRQACDALAEAHAIGLVHRDIKPANIMLCDRGGVPDFVKVLDFGVAKQLDAATASNVSSADLIGTPMFMAPEAIHAKTPVDGRTDMYALAVVAYYLLTGTSLFDGKTVIEVCLKHMSASPEPLAARYPEHDASAELEALLMQCLEKEPDKRPESVEVLSRALGKLEMAEWTHDQARGWWKEKGVVVQSRIRDKRGPREGASSAQTLAVADFRPDADAAR